MYLGGSLYSSVPVRVLDPGTILLDPGTILTMRIPVGLVHSYDAVSVYLDERVY